MIKQIAKIVALSLPLSLIPAGAVSAETQCITLNSVLGPCPSSSPQPAPSGSAQPSSPPAAQPQSPGNIAEVPGAADRLLQLVNNERGTRGLPGLTARSDVANVANGHSANMAAKRTIWHNDAYFTASNRSNLGASMLAENVAMNSSVEDAHVRLMNSPGHRANILDGRLTQAGFSVVHDESGQLYLTQNFMTPKNNGATATPVKAKAKGKAATARKSRGSKRSKAGVRRARTARR